MKKEELIQYHEYWREHLDEFVEEVFGLKLFPYQKEIIKVICAS